MTMQDSPILGGDINFNGMSQEGSVGPVSMMRKEQQQLLIE